MCRCRCRYRTWGSSRSWSMYTWSCRSKEGSRLGSSQASLAWYRCHAFYLSKCWYSLVLSGTLPGCFWNQCRSLQFILCSEFSFKDCPRLGASAEISRHTMVYHHVLSGINSCNFVCFFKIKTLLKLFVYDNELQYLITALL